jgi:hypothetical protein
MKRSIASIALLAFSLGTAPATAELPVIERAERAVAAGAVDPARDVGPILEALRRSRDVDERRALVGAIGDLGETDAESPNAVKEYLRENAAPVLLEVAKTGANPFLQGDALATLRGLGVSRAILEQAAAIAEASPDAFVQSRGEIMRNYIRSLPAEDSAAATRPTDPEKRRAAIAYLDQRQIAVSTQALRDAAMRADPETVRALLDAGVAPDSGATDTTQTPLYFATFHACHSQGAETDWLVETVQILVAAGADLARTDDNRNGPLLHAAHYCGPRIIGILVGAGAKVDARNGSGVTPLTMALVSGNFDAAEALVARGARIRKEDRLMVSGVTDPRGKALIQRASN